MIFYANIDLGYEDNVFDVLGGYVDNFLSLGYLRGYDPSIDPYCVYVGDLPRKVMLTVFFNPCYDFSMGFDKVKRILAIFHVVLVITSFLVFSKLWSQKFDKSSRNLTASALMVRVLKL